MTMPQFPPFGPPNTVAGVGSFNPPAAPAQPAFGAPMSSAQALAGLGNADVESRSPFLPPGFAGRIKLSRIYERNVTKANLGLCYFAEGIVTDIANAGGPEFWSGKRQDNAQLSPAIVGGEYACRISGISEQNKQAAALREYRELLCAIWAHRGLTQNFGQEKLTAARAPGDANAVAAVEREIAETFWRYGVMTAQYQAILDGRIPGDRAMAEQFAAEITGRHILVQTSVHVGQTGWGKLKHRFFADSTSAEVSK